VISYFGPDAIERTKRFEVEIRLDSHVRWIILGVELCIAGLHVLS